MLRHVPYPLPELFQRLLAPIVGNREPWRWTCLFPIVLTDGRFQQDADRSIGCGSLPAQAKTESRASIDAKSASTVQEPSKRVAHHGTFFDKLRFPRSLNLLANLGKLRPIRESRGREFVRRAPGPRVPGLLVLQPQ